MIVKELDPLVSDDKYAKAGYRAEVTMAHYLKRYFKESTDIHVLNSIRIEHDNDAAQMDHLVIHPFGMIIVESKSVHGKLQIKDDGQWIRRYSDYSKGMASPITQAKLQGNFLRSVLNKAAKPEGFFNKMPIDILVSISDEGEIWWPPSGKLDEVWKADQICDRIEALIVESSRLAEGKPFLVSSHASKLSEYLCKVHKPLIKQESKGEAGKVIEQEQKPKTKGFVKYAKAFEDKFKEIASAAIPKGFDVKMQKEPSQQGKAVRAGKLCRFCGSFNLEIKYGHSYYFHCHDCTKSTPIHSICPSCNNLEKLRKQGKQYFVECVRCGTSHLYYTNT